MKITSKALRERMGEEHDAATALVNLAETEERDLTAEEKTAFDGHMAEFARIEKEDLPRAEWLEKEQERLAETRGKVPLQRSNGDGLDSATQDLPLAKRISLPANVYRTGKLKAFHGPDAEVEAYISGQWLLAALFKRPAAIKWCEDNGVPIVKAALTTGDNSLGGFLVPNELERSIIDLREQYGVFRANARVVPMAGDTLQIPRRTGGVTAYFVTDNQEITASDKAWDMVELTARKLAALIKYSSELSEDAIISIADDLAREIAYAFAVKEDACGFIGTGTSTYGGIQGLITVCAAATATVVTAATANTAFSTLDLTDFESMIGKLPEYPGIDPKWYISKAGYAASMMRLIDAAGGNTIATLEGGASGRQFLGYPVVISQTMNSTLTAQTSTDGICYFGDLRMACTMGDRRGIGLLVSEHRYMEYDQLAIKGTERFAINIHDVGDTSNPGAMIMMATPAS